MDRIQDLKVEQIMTPAPTCLAEDCTFAGTLAFLVRERHQSAPVLDRAGRLVGIVTRAGLLGWLRQLVQESGGALALRDLMDRAISAAVERPVCVAPDVKLEEAARLLVRSQAPALLVTHGEATLGILTLHDVARAVAYGDQPAPAAARGRGHCFTPDGLPGTLADEAAERELMTRLSTKKP